VPGRPDIGDGSADNGWLRHVSVRRVLAGLWLLALAWVPVHPAQASEKRLGALGFERPLGERRLLRTWQRQTALRDLSERHRDREHRSAPRIRRITEDGRPGTGQRDPAPVSGAMAARRDRYAPLIEAAAARQGVDADLVHAVIRAESAYRPRAQSPAGACGLMQLMPATARRFGVRDIWNPAENIEGGVAYLRFLQDRFDGDIRLVLAAYNAGEGAVARYGNRVPPYRETRTYVRRALGYLGSA
jgi:hypothetical protein